MFFKYTNIFVLLILSILYSCDDNVEIKVLNKMPVNVHPHIAYWFITPDLLQNDKYLSDLDSIAANAPFDMLFLSAREGCDFYDTTVMKPVFSKLVSKAHNKGIKIGLQLWNYPNILPEEYCQRTISEGCITLNSQGIGIYKAEAKHIRPKNFYKTTEISAFKTKLLRVFAFKEISDGIYDPETLKDITAFCTTDYSNDGKSALIRINCGTKLAGYSVYLLCEHIYNHPDMFVTSQLFDKILSQYASIPFDGTALDEFGYMRITPPWEIKSHEYFTERFISPQMKLKLEKIESSPAEITLFHMRYYPKDSAQIKIRAINNYMKVLRSGVLNVENDFYKSSKKYFGEDCIVGVHNTFHNSLIGDEYWITGANWWTIKRDYGQSDEHSILPTQLGIAFCNSQNVIYNMFYHTNADTLCKKALTDLRFGIRTHYHAFNDKHWGLGLESKQLLDKIKPVENAAALLNLFNPALPDVKLLIVFGTNELLNWFPDKQKKSNYYLNKSVDPESIALSVYNAGYMNALVPDDVIENGILKLNAESKAAINGRIFNVILLLYPQFMKKETLFFFRDFAQNGGKLLLYGDAQLDFYGKSVDTLFTEIKKYATPFDITNIEKTGIEKNVITEGCYTADNSVVLTNYASVVQNKYHYFEVEIDKNKFSGSYKGMLALKCENGKISKIVSTGLKELKKNGKKVLSFDEGRAFFYDVVNSKKCITIFDEKMKKRPKIISKL